MRESPAAFTFTFRHDVDESYRAGQSMVADRVSSVAWVPFAVLAALVVYSYVEGPQLGTMWPAWALALGAASLSFIVPGWLRKRNARAVPPAGAGAQRYELHPQRLVVHGDHASLSYDWAAMRAVEEVPDFFLFRLDDRQVLVLPKRAVGDDAACDAVRAFLHTTLGGRARLSADMRRLRG